MLTSGSLSECWLPNPNARGTAALARPVSAGDADGSTAGPSRISFVPISMIRAIMLSCSGLGRVGIRAAVTKLFDKGKCTAETSSVMRRPTGYLLISIRSQ